jgi:hypothetical protein
VVLRSGRRSGSTQAGGTAHGTPSTLVQVPDTGVLVSVVTRAQQREVGDIRSARPRPPGDVVGVAPTRGCAAAGDHAGPVPGGEHPALGRGDRPHAAAEVQRGTVRDKRGALQQRVAEPPTEQPRPDRIPGALLASRPRLTPGALLASRPRGRGDLLGGRRDHDPGPVTRDDAAIRLIESDPRHGDDGIGAALAGGTPVWDLDQCAVLGLGRSGRSGGGVPLDRRPDDGTGRRVEFRPQQQHARRVGGQAGTAAGHRLRVEPVAALRVDHRQQLIADPAGVLRREARRRLGQEGVDPVRTGRRHFGEGIPAGLDPPLQQMPGNLLHRPDRHVHVRPGHLTASQGGAERRQRARGRIDRARRRDIPARVPRRGVQRMNEERARNATRASPPGRRPDASPTRAPPAGTRPPPPTAPRTPAAPPPAPRRRTSSPCRHAATAPAPPARAPSRPARDAPCPPPLRLRSRKGR